MSMFVRGALGLVVLAGLGVAVRAQPPEPVRRNDLVLFSAEVSDRPTPSITLVRRAAVAGPTPFRSYGVYRRIEGEPRTAWQVLTYDSGAATRIEDRQVRTNVVYEYAFGPPNWMPPMPEYKPPSGGDLSVAIGLAPEHRRGRVILLVEEGLLARGSRGLRTELEAFRQDLVGDGWQVTPALAAPRHDDAKAWRERYDAASRRDRETVVRLIREHYVAGQNHVVILVGHVTIPFSGIAAHDNHHYPADCHRGPWVCDGYYGSLDKSLWHDQRIQPPTAGNCEQATPGDGLFDEDDLPSVDLVVGRIDFARMPGLAGAPFLPAGARTEAQVELALTRQYFEKNRRYRLGRIPWPERVVVWDGITGYGEGEQEAARFAGPWLGLAEDRVIRASPFTAGLPAVLGLLHTHGRPTGLAVDGQRWFYVPELKQATNEPPVLFHNLIGSWFMDWNWSPDNLVRGVLATPNYGLACLTWHGWAWDKLALGRPLADTLVHRTMDRQAFKSILGDPTLRLSRVAPVANVRAVRAGRAVTVRWDAAAEPDTTCFVYRSANGLEGFGAPLEAAGSAAGEYTDADAPTGRLMYLVRASRLVRNGAGTFHDLGQGTVVEVR